MDQLPVCSAQPADTVDIAPGCRPEVDGTLHLEEWSDGTCFPAADLAFRGKYEGDYFYMAFSGPPTCGCPIWLVIDPDSSGGADGDEFAIGVFDDPFGADGDRAELVLQAGQWQIGAAPDGITVLCPGASPNPVRYEWSIPMSALGLAPGGSGGFRMAIVHADATWPADVDIPAGQVLPIDPDGWATVESSSAWM